MPTPAGIDREALAAEYGWSYAVLKSDKELFGLFNRMVKEGWTEPKFVAELRSTKWFQKHGEAWRQNEVLRRADPATHKLRGEALFAKLRDQAQQMGAQIGTAALKRVTNNAMAFGWDEAQVRNTLASFIKAGTSGPLKYQYVGQAGENAAAMRQYAHQMGVKVGDPRGWLRQMAAGDVTVDDYKLFIQKYARTAFPNWEKEIAAGMTVADLAAPYTQSMAQVLEINPQDIDLFDPTIRKALSAPGADGKPAAKPLWQFENELRQDKRWNRTKNAQDALMGTGTQILRQMGLVT